MTERAARRRRSSDQREPEQLEPQQLDEAVSAPVPVVGLARSAAAGADPLGGSQVPADIVGALRKRAGGGVPLPAQLAEPLGAELRTDLGPVRVHADAEADTLARSVQASAFTYGTDIYFARGQYAPESTAGQHLIAHELSHVAQRAHGQYVSTGGAPTIGRADDPAERDAEATASVVVGALRRSADPMPVGLQAAPMTVGPDVRRMTVNGTAIKPYGKTGKDLWEYVRQNLYSTYGTKDVYLKEFCKSDVDYATPELFLQAFTKRLAELGKLRTLNLGRPAWPKEYKELLSFKPGDNIRHVVRNATLKRALLDDYEDTKLLAEDHYGGQLNGEALAVQVEHELVTRYGQMAATLGVNSNSKSSERIVHDIYNALYLNEGNLFAGVGGDNQLIGFLADPMEDFGRQLRAQGERSVSINEVYSHIWKLTVTSYEKVKGRAGKSGTLVKLNEFMKTLEVLIEDRRVQWIKEANGGMLDKDAQAPAYLLAEDPIDFGANFGFDLLDVRPGEDGEFGAAERNKILAEVETELSGEILPGTDDLLDILKKFMSLPRLSG